MLRRFKDELTVEKLERYFADVDIERISNGKYNTFAFYRKGIYVANFNGENYKVERGEKIGYYIPLSQEQSFSGASFLDVEWILYEEFMSRTNYLRKETEKLQIFYDTVDRKRGFVKVALLGNTITRVCPYFADWGITRDITSMKQGEIKVVNINNNVSIALEYTGETKQKSLTIGKAGEMIKGGKWLADEQPHLQESIKNYKPCFRCVFCYNAFSFLATYYIGKENKGIWYIVPKYTEIKEKTLVISNVVKESYYYIRDIYNLPPRFKNTTIQTLFNNFREENIFYCTDSCGTDFKQCIDFIIKR